MKWIKTRQSRREKNIGQNSYALKIKVIKQNGKKLQKYIHVTLSQYFKKAIQKYLTKAELVILDWRIYSKE